MTYKNNFDIPSIATKSLIYELSISPKPGLVDRYDNGAHNDMNYFTFIESIFALSEYFQSYYEFGKKNSHTDDLSELFYGVRDIGQKAETAMFTATNGINTHKGANFSMALFLVAIGYIQANKKISTWTQKDSDTIFEIIKKMTADILDKDFKNIENKKHLSYGEKLYIEHGMQGIRGEALNGYPIIKNLLLPYLRAQIYPIKEVNYLRALLLLMSTIEDGNIIHRGGIEMWKTVKEETYNLFSQNFDDETLISLLIDYNNRLIKRHISPGGAADALALGIFMIQLENYNIPS